MIVDLNNTSDYDKQIIYLDSRNAIFPNKNEFSFNIKFDEKIKNLTSVKIIESSLVLNGKLGLKWEYVGTTAPTGDKITNTALTTFLDYANTEITPAQYKDFNVEGVHTNNHIILATDYVELVPGLMWSNVGFTQPNDNTTEYVNANLTTKLLEKYCANDTILNLTRAEYNSYIVGNSVPAITNFVKLIPGVYWEKSTTANTAPGATLIKTLNNGNALRTTFINASDTTKIEISKEQLRTITTANLVSGNYISIPINDTETYYYIPKTIYFKTAVLYFKPVRRITYNSTFYVELNNYDRVHSYIAKYDSCNSVVNYNTVKFFDTLNYSGTTESSLVLYKIKNYYSLASSNWTDPTVYILNPPETSCNRFTITIRDKDFNILKFGDYLNEESFNMTICAYTIKKNIYG
jgi:hypothetical protein